MLLSVAKDRYCGRGAANAGGKGVRWQRTRERALGGCFLFDVLYGVPAIVYGTFGFMLMVFLGLKASLLAGIITVAILIIPIMARGMDEVLKIALESEPVGIPPPTMDFTTKPVEDIRH